MADLNYTNYTPISRLAVNLGGIQVNRDSRFKNILDLCDYIKAHPRRLKASGSGLNSSWHLNLIGMLDSMGLSANAVTFVPSQGSSSALMELVSGGVDFTTSSPGEAKAMVAAGMVRHLATMAEKAQGLYQDVPVFSEATPYKYSFSAWNALVAPAGLPENIANKLIDTMKQVFAEGNLKNYANKQGFEVYPLYGDDMKKFMKSEDEKYAELINKLKK